ncbi:MAG TPA: PP2C family protein-serine/threonine phosphatase [Solirubrobacteraceae bacterium]|nr:PP2C family protein-serine/threonine phosphatase [Solirubrobacteraceae bacterium]
MGRDPTATTARRRRRSRLATALAATCCALALTLAFIPAATARRDQPSTPAPAPPPSTSSPSNAKPDHAEAEPSPAQPPAPASAQPETPPAPARSPAAHHDHHRASGETGATTNAGTGAGTSSGSTPAASGAAAEPSTAGPSTAGPHHRAVRHDGDGRGSAHRQERLREQQSAEAQEAGAQPTLTDAQTSTQAKKGTGKEKERKERKEKKEKKEAEGKREHEGKGKGHKGTGESGEGSGESGSGTGESAGAGGSPAALAASVLTAQAPAAAAVPTPLGTVQTSPSAERASKAAAGGEVSNRAYRSRHARSGTRAPAHPLELAAAGLAPAAATAGAASAPRTPRGARKGATKSSSAGPSSQLVTTITKFVDVVPTAVRGLIAALLALALALAVRSRVAAVRARRLERQRVELLADVGLLQAALLPVPPARLGPVGTSAAYQPAAGPGAGGDFYDVFALDDGQLAIIVGDVSGHGRQALPHTALVRFTLRAYLEAGLSPRDAVQTAGAVLDRQLGGAFATVIAATYNPRERLLVYSSAGHPPPVILPLQEDAGSIPPVTICAAPPIGVGMRTGTRQTVVSVPGGAQICFHTDGVTEARVGSDLFGTERLLDTLAELGPSATAPALLEHVAELADERPDDMAACLLHIEGPEQAPTVLVEELELDREEATSARTERFLLACGLTRSEVAEALRTAAIAAGRAGTIVLEVRRGDGAPEVALRRENLAYIHARRGSVGVAL